MKIPKITLEQWAALRAVVDEGSFARAAERLNKSQSTISYAISRIENMLPVPVLQQEGRRAVLTEAGQALYRRAVLLLDEAARIEQSASAMAQGWEPELTISVDQLVDMDRLLRALDRFSHAIPSTRLRLLENTLSGSDEALLEKKADIVLTPNIPIGFIGKPLHLVEMIPVASKNHAVFQIGGPVSSEQLRRYRQIVIRDTGVRRNRDSGWLAAEQRWTVSHFATSVRILKQSMGFAFVPRHGIQEELQQGSLKQIELALEGSRFIQTYLVMADVESAGPAAQALAKELLSTFADNHDPKRA
ncbi:MAG: LysR family transcriptional regulator [Hahellaceae bacterium]|nr:LysR family transcriptional regulator [Hahellaceae bacterium]